MKTLSAWPVSLLCVLVSSIPCWGCQGDFYPFAEGEDADSAPTAQDTNTQTETNIDTDSNTEIAIVVTIEEETPGYCSSTGFVERIYDGFEGSGYINTQENLNQNIEWNVLSSGGITDISWRYALAVEDRSATLWVNGQKMGALIFSTTNSWVVWNQSAPFTVELTAGGNSIRLVATGDFGLPNMDSITLTGPDLVPDNCVPEL